MNLVVLVAIVAAGLAVVFVALRLSGAGRSRSLDSAQDALALLRADYPDVRDGPVLRTADRAAAFVLAPCGRTGIVRVVGRHVATRLVDERDLHSVGLEEPATLRIAFREFGWSAIAARLEDAQAARRLLAHLKPATGGT
ncbi:MAG: hypothetical protein CMJ42_13095 [Phyllobacteriaceae bacterium]|nr:hypothetical protein [Phyllobacteriaceae bacterium]MBA89670.1 hypothetical protein [Phyllobacteriaceae bacterium]